MNRPSWPPRAVLRVVVIDDDEFEREFLVDVLKQAGFKVTSLPSVIGVTNHLIQEHVQVVVLDVMMPAIRGDKLAALLRKSPALQGLRVVLVSALPEEELASLMAGAQIDAFVPKALVRTKLAATIARIAVL